MLFETQEEVKEHISVNANFEIKDIKPSLRQAVNKYIIPAIGEPFFTELLAAHELGGATQWQNDAIWHVQEALANYTYFLYTAIGFVQIGNAGIQETSGEGGSSARQWVTYDLKAALLDAGDVALDAALLFLEQNKQHYPTWSGSSAYTVSNELFLKNAAELSEFVNIQNSRRTYLALRPYIAKAERHFIKSTISNELFRELKTAIKTGVLSPEQHELVALIRPALAQLAVYKALPEIDIRVSAEGIKVQSFSNGIIKRDPASDNQKSTLAVQLEVDGNADLGDLQQFLFDNADDYPTFLESKLYLDRQPSDYNMNSKYKKNFKA